MLLFLVVLFALLGAGAFVFEAAKGPLVDKLIAVGLALLSIAVACLGAWHLHVLGKI